MHDLQDSPGFLGYELWYLSPQWPLEFGRLKASHHKPVIVTRTGDRNGLGNLGIDASIHVLAKEQKISLNLSWK